MVPTHDPYEAAAISLREKEGRLVAELEAVRKSLAAIEAARAAAGFHAYPAQRVTGEHPTEAATQIVSGGKFKNAGLGEALVKQLADSNRIEQTAKQLWNAISEAGFSILSERPEAAANWALRKREKKEADIILTGDGKWGMTSWYSDEQLREFRARRNNASTRNHDEHVEKTKAGIANAKRTRMDHWGPKRKITGEQFAAAYYARPGARSKLQLAKAADMAWPTFNLYWRQYEMEKWKPGDPFPPQRRAVEKKNSEIKLEDMWSPESGYTNGHTQANGPQH